MTKRFSVLFSLILTFMFTSVFAVNVTLNVDMENVTVSDDGVHVAGSFQGWDAAATALTDDDGDGWAVEDGDCDDSNPDIHPDAVEYCNGEDDDCDADVDEDSAVDASIWFADDDADGYGDASTGRTSI